MKNLTTLNMMPSTRPTNVVFVVFDGFQLLDYSGVAAVFEMANRCAKKLLYDCVVINIDLSASARASNGISVNMTHIANIDTLQSDFVIVVGGEEEGLLKALDNEPAMQEFSSLCERSKMQCSICSGAFFLAAIGALNNKNATTHWSAVDVLRSNFPNINVRENVLYTMDGNTFTSAGVSTGIDLALEIVAQQHGVRLSNDVAKRLVVSAHRPANASQISLSMIQQQDTEHNFAELIRFLQHAINKEVSVEEMAEFTHMSERNFARKFHQAIGMPPHRYFKYLKVEHAKSLLSRGYTSSQIQEAIGYKTELGLNKAFVQVTGMTVYQLKKQMAM
ncbi:GlxA family transcriptional regulator [Glaciecola siphonariae]|uniref:GlxA family transcriptional regulator n=1 Tax=Glaciecola siphonariae TaxID=521012 RepID=A0ABV9LXV3_9ALTE